MKWLEHVKQVAEGGFSPATSDAQITDDCDDLLCPESESFT